MVVPLVLPEEQPRSQALSPFPRQEGKGKEPWFKWCKGGVTQDCAKNCTSCKSNVTRDNFKPIILNPGNNVAGFCIAFQKSVNMLPGRNVALKVALCAMLHDNDNNTTINRITCLR